MNYHGEGDARYVLHNAESGQQAPLSVTLDLVFAEATITTRENVRQVGGR